MGYDVRLFRRAQRACHDHAPAILYDEGKIVWVVYRLLKKETLWKLPPKWLADRIALDTAIKMWGARPTVAKQVREIHEQSDRLHRELFG
jgi:hypothetical protein